MAKPGDLQQGWTDIPYAIPNLRVENGSAKAHVRIGWLRSVANIYHGFAVQSFSDELAHRAKRDPVEYLLDLLGPARKVDLARTIIRTTMPQRMTIRSILGGCVRLWRWWRRNLVGKEKTGARFGNGDCCSP
jgi:CO/xanthine dehydrogenase Mo-binding subunit